MLRIEKLKVGDLPALTFEVKDGECLAIEAPSGAGKTRLLRAIADLDDAQGQVFLDGAERREMPATEWRRLIRFVAAEPGWWGDTPRVSFPVATPSGPRLTRLLRDLGLEEALLDRPIALLSTGERQRLGLVRALLDEPRVVLLDEPTSALDASSAALVEELLRFLILSGRTVIIATHDLALTSRLAHNRLILPRPRTASAAQGVATEVRP